MCQIEAKVDGGLANLLLEIASLLEDTGDERKESCFQLFRRHVPEENGERVLDQL